jgi:hypothetical protein
MRKRNRNWIKLGGREERGKSKGSNNGTIRRLQKGLTVYPRMEVNRS